MKVLGSALIGLVLLAGCKTANSNPPAASQTLDIQTNVRTFKKARVIGPNAAAQFKQWPGEPRICFADVNSPGPYSSVALYRCAEEANITTDNALIMYSYKENLYESKNNQKIGWLGADGELLDICSGYPYSKTCEVSYTMDPSANSNPFILRIKVPYNPGVWTYKNIRLQEVRGKELKRLLDNMPNGRICFGLVETEYGQFNAIYPCAKVSELNFLNTKILQVGPVPPPGIDFQKTARTMSNIDVGEFHVIKGVTTLEDLCTGRKYRDVCAVTYDGKQLVIIDKAAK